MRSGCQSKNFRTSRGGTEGNITRPRTYEPNLDRPPTVKRTIWIEQTMLVPWSLEDEKALGTSQVAGMQFRQQLSEYRRKNKPTAAETKALINLAERAICKDNNG